MKLHCARQTEKNILEGINGGTFYGCQVSLSALVCLSCGVSPFLYLQSVIKMNMSSCCFVSGAAQGRQSTVIESNSIPGIDKVVKSRYGHNHLLHFILQDVITKGQRLHQPNGVDYFPGRRRGRGR